ncbi:hypothetical protein BJ912DRAFT_950065 [Pholiota molesta]|nr:hypothetical protein BJ912DRAFT_950065 [Pholiota molesta]
MPMGIMGWISGREKLDLLVENMGEKSRTTGTFSLKKCLEMAKSQTDAFVNDISNLKDPHKFRSLVKQELQARTEPSRTDLRINLSDHVAMLVATRIHNSYMLASAWKMVSDRLNEFAVEGLTDQNAKLQLQSNADMRARYLVLCNMVDVLVKMNQDRSAVLATTAPHYAKYFKLKRRKSSSPTELEYIFDWTYLRDAAEFFLDSIFIELCFPQGQYPQAVLYRILRDAVNEFSQARRTKRFPPALWNAVGDLFISLELQELLAAPLFGLEEEPWKSQPRQMPEEYESWVDAQIFSLQASNMFTNFKDMIDPLYKTKRKSNLDNVWKQIDQVNLLGLCS